jgi:hypothetical protein
MEDDLKTLEYELQAIEDEFWTWQVIDKSTLTIILRMKARERERLHDHAYNVLYFLFVAVTGTAVHVLIILTETSIHSLPCFRKVKQWYGSAFKVLFEAIQNLSRHFLCNKLLLPF